MQVVLPISVTNQLIDALNVTKHHETGGILMGEHIDTNRFRVTSVTIQQKHGSVFSFRRVIKEILEPLRSFFNATNHNYQRFNYLGEWHSHPSFTLEPSSADCETMWDIVEDPHVGARFAILLIFKVNDGCQLDGTVTVFLPNNQRFRGELIQEGINTL